MSILAALGIAVAMPPVTLLEALDFHRTGVCQMMEPGKGMTRADGWVVSSLPGPHSFYAKGGSTSLRQLDMTPGKAYQVKLTPGATLYWCPKFRPEGRDACGPVPSAFLYDVVTK